MSHKLISKIQNPDLGMDFEQEFLVESLDVNLVEYLLKYRFAVLSDDSKPLPPKGSGLYEAKSYPQGRFIYKDNALYMSNITTSSTWVLSEWNLILQGA